MNIFHSIIIAGILLLATHFEAKAQYSPMRPQCRQDFGQLCSKNTCNPQIDRPYIDKDGITTVMCVVDTLGSRLGKWKKFTPTSAAPPPPPPPTPCNPYTSLSCVDQPCEAAQLGVSLMQLDKKLLIICLIKDDSSGYEWKSMVDDYQSSTLWTSSPEFYEDTEGTWVGAACPDKKIMTGIKTVNVGMGGHNFWSIDCR